MAEGHNNSLDAGTSPSDTAGDQSTTKLVTEDTGLRRRATNEPDSAVKPTDHAYPPNGGAAEDKDKEAGNGKKSRFSDAAKRVTSNASTNNASGPGTLSRMKTALTETKPVGEEPTWGASLRAIVVATWLNVLLIFIPISWALFFVWGSDCTSTQGTIIFICAFLAIIPLAKLLGFGTEELAMRVGQTLGGLLNATLGNAVELIIAIIALTKCQLNVVQSSLLGSILSNLLLVLGMCFFAGGVRFSEQGFKETASQLNSSLLIMAVIAVLIPAGFHGAFGSTINDPAERGDILKMSRGTSVIILVVYVAYLTFQLWTHAHLYDEKPGDDSTPTKTGRKAWGKHRVLRAAKSVRNKEGPGSIRLKPPPQQPAEADEGGYEDEDDDEEEPETPSMNVWATIALLVGVTVLVGVTSEFLVDSISKVTESGKISTQWVGLILLPIVGNAAEHVTAVTVSVHDKLDLSISVAVGSSIQIALFVIPLLVVLGWILDKPLSLLFDPFESIVLFLAVLIVTFATQDGKSNWLEGFLLMCVYLIVAVSFWFYPQQNTPEAAFLVCGPVLSNGSTTAPE